jgi:glucose-6-phosphate 1-dehydrogenase
MLKADPADALILFGITGDLARRRLFPALYEMAASDELDIPVIGVARTEGEDDDLRSWARQALEENLPGFEGRVFDRLAQRLCYVSGDYVDASTYEEISRRTGGKDCTVSYLAVPPHLFDDVVTGLAGADLNGRGRVVVEKPFGRDTQSAAELNEIIGRHFPEERVYRIDHFLGKESLQNLMVYRFSNTILEPIWNRHYIRGVQITMAEDFGVEGRGGFYDTVGAMRDVVQNHLLVLVSLLAMEPPVSDRPDALRDERVKVLDATNPIRPSEVVRGQYEGYVDEPGVPPDSDTETFFASRVEIDSWRWAGVPWVLRAGKGMGATVTEAVVEFHRPPRMLFADTDAVPGPNRLVFRSKPEDSITLSMQARRPGLRMVSGPVDFELAPDSNEGTVIDAYHRLLGDALRGDQSLFAREDGVMESWRVVQPVLDDPSPTMSYPKGSWGPEDSDNLLGDSWEWLTGPKSS